MWPFSKKQQPQQTFVIAPGVGRQPMARIRRGMWVVCREKIGILDAVTVDGQASIHYVNKQGETVLVVNEPLGDLRQARFDEIKDILAARAGGHAVEYNEQLKRQGY